MAITLYVWLGRGDNPGHVSLQVGATYMSYWPGEEAGKKDFKVKQTHPPAFPNSYRMDRRLERRESDVRMELHGLDEQRILDSWATFRREPARYNMVKHNCSTVIASLLEFGSGVPPSFTPQIRIDDHVRGWPERLLLRLRFLGNHIHMWTPNAVHRYALAVRARMEKR